ncbi:MAG: hypothetical protein PUC00_01605 [Clostridiales bacterium]|nr:hypothetical protein [Clostridiales bacterium]
MENDKQNSVTPTQSTPMKWHKFLIYFGLWLGGILTALTGVGLVTGSAYETTGSTADQVYRVFPSLQPVDVVMGIFAILLGALMIVARFDLARFKHNGPKRLYIVYGANAAFVLVYPLLVSAMTTLSFMELLDIGSLIGSILGIVINKVYYDKRMHLFVN